MAEIILGALCLIAGVVCAFFCLLTLWAGALERSATGAGGGGPLAAWLAVVAIAGIVGGLLLIF